MMCGLSSELSFTISVPVRVPVFVGTKETVKKQGCNMLGGTTGPGLGGGSVPRQFWLTEKSPVVDMLETVRSVKPESAICMPRGVLVVSGVSGKLSDEGEINVNGALGNPERLTKCGESRASSVIRMAPFW